VTRAAQETIADEFKAFIGDFRAVVSSSLAIVETVANIEVRSKDNAGIMRAGGGIGFF
jgi:hypothetical protein